MNDDVTVIKCYADDTLGLATEFDNEGDLLMDVRMDGRDGTVFLSRSAARELWGLLTRALVGDEE